jgi:glycosyltransferase involved in cell wall biosynthesis
MCRVIISAFVSEIPRKQDLSREMPFQKDYIYKILPVNKNHKPTCLPRLLHMILVLFTSDSGGKNPYHRLLFDALSQNSVQPIYHDFPIFLPLTRKILSNDDIEVIHLDWLYDLYIARDYTESRLLNTIITLGRAIWFCVDICAVKLCGVKLVWTVHNLYHHERYYPRTERILNIIIARLVDRITVKCADAKQMVHDAYAVRDISKISIVPDGHYIEAYPNNVERNKARTWLNVEDAFVYMFFGSIRSYKGVVQLCNTFRSIDDDDAVLWIVGSPKTEELESEISSLATLDPRVHTQFESIPEDEVQYYMNSADVVVFPYQRILNSGSVYLGLSFGKRIIAPRIGCIPSVVQSRHNLLYEANNEYGLRDALIEAKADIDSRVAEANIQVARKHSWQSVAQLYITIYNDIIS